MIRLNGVRAWTNRPALDALRHLAADIIDGCIVEVGVREGGTLREIAQAARVRCFGVDAWGLPGAYADPANDAAAMRVDEATMTTATANLHDLNVHLIRSLSVDAAREWSHGPIAMLHIDAAHEHAAVLADFHAWAPHLASGAVVTFDDYKPTRWPGVVAAVDQLLAEGHLTHIDLIGNRLEVTRVRS